MEAKVYPAGPPLQGQWVLAWRTNIMPASAYWYYDSEQAARDAESRMVRHINRAQDLTTLMRCECCMKAETPEA